MSRCGPAAHTKKRPLPRRQRPEDWMEIAGSELGGREGLQMFAEDGFSRGNTGEQLVGDRIGEVIPEERS